MPLLTDQDWIARLKAPDNSAALEDLRQRLARGLTYALASRIPPEQLDDAVQDFVQEAVLRVLANLDTFRGESRFLTWATKVAVRLAFSELRRKRWQDISLEKLLGDEQGMEESNSVLADPAPSPETLADLDMVMGLVQRVIDEELTEHQRSALRAVMDSGMQLEEVAFKMGTNRNAFYKLLHDARKRLQQRLAKHGLSADDLLAVIDEQQR
jgi:RNA polymerase sigma-70 factor (ECF subfamily)